MSFRDTAGLTHSVDVTASTLYEAVALGVRAFRQYGLLTECHVGSATGIDVEVRNPPVRHSTSVGRLMQWLESAGSPKEMIEKERILALLKL